MDDGNKIIEDKKRWSFISMNAYTIDEETKY